MLSLKITCSAFSFVFLALLLTNIGYSATQITVEYLYWDPSTEPNYCDTCPSWGTLYFDFINKNKTVTRVSIYYAGRATFEWVDITSADGIARKQLYNVSSPNSLVINSEYRLEGSFSETTVKQAIDATLEGLAPSNSAPTNLLPTIALAFSFGFFETFSPCLIALLSFVLSYSIGKDPNLLYNFSKVMLFGVGFVVAALIVGLSMGLTFLSFQPLNTISMWLICIFALFFGINMIGIFKTPLETKPLLRKIAKKHAFTLSGLLFLGFIFYFLDPCVAPFFFAALPILAAKALPIVVLFFCLGVVIPFFFMGLLAGYMSRLARLSYKHKSTIRVISGLILISYAFYIILFHIM